MIVVDASAALSGLFNHGPARAALSHDQVHAPHLIDSEVASGVRRRVAAGDLTPGAGWQLLDRWRHLALTRHPVFGVLERVWELRDNLSAYDASYVALAETLDCPLLTVDARLTRAPGVLCPITLVPA